MIRNLITIFLSLIILLSFPYGQDTLSPRVEFLVPGYNGAFSCRWGCITVKITDPNLSLPTLSPATIWISLSPPIALQFEYPPLPGDSIFRFCLPEMYTFNHGDSVYVMMPPVCDDFSNCTDSLNWVFWIDLRTPNITLLSPPTGYISNPNFVFKALVTDEPAGIMPESSSVIVEVRGRNNWVSSQRFVGGLAQWRLDTITINVPTLGPIAGGDSVKICVRAHDCATGCGANTGEQCFTYYLPLTPPTITPIFPASSITTACPDSVVFAVSDLDSLVSVWATVGADTYRLGNPRVTFTSGRFMARTTGVPQGYVTITAGACDWWNTCTQTSWNFWVDTTPPRVLAINPPDSTVQPDTNITVRIWIGDNLSGVNWSSVSLTVDGTVTAFSYETGGAIAFNYVASGLDSSSWITMEICIRAADSPNMCINHLDTCFFYDLFVSAGYPTVSPPAFTITGCGYQDMQIATVTTFGIDSSSVDLTITSMRTGSISTYRLSSPQLWMTTHELGIGRWLDSVFFQPSAQWLDNDTLSCSFFALEATHTINHHWYFYTDFSPPRVQVLYPSTGSVEMTIPNEIRFNLWDAVSGIWEPSFSCTIWVDGVPHNVPYAVITRVGHLHKIPLDAIGISLSGCDTVRIALHVDDRVLPQYCGPNHLDTSWSFSLDCTVPWDTLISPPRGAILSCPNQSVRFLLYNDTNLNWGNIFIVWDGETARWGDSRLTRRGDTLIFTPSISWSDGQIINGYISHLYDFVGNWFPAQPFNFVLDFSPPAIVPVSPTPGELLTDSLARFSVRIFDLTSGVADYGISATFGSHFTESGGDTFIFDPGDEGAILGPEDTVKVTIWAGDRAAGCGANYDTLSYHFLVDALGPRPIYIDTFAGVTSCNNREIVFAFEDFLGVNPARVRLFSSHEDETLTAPTILVRNDTILYSPSTGYYHGENVTIELLSAPDFAGNRYVGEHLVVNFTVDLLPPEFTLVQPIYGAEISTVLPEVRFVIEDSPAGLYWESCTLSVSGTWGDTMLLWGDALLSVVGDTLSLVLGPPIFVLYGGDTIRVCVSIWDEIDECSPHRSDTCTEFYIVSTPPNGGPVRPGFYAISSCPDQSVSFFISDSEGVDWTSVTFSVNSETLDVTHPWVSILGDTVIYTPDTNYNSDTIMVCILTASDVLGNTIPLPICWEFYIDTQSPVMIYNYPPNGARVGSVPTLIAVFDDSMSGFITLDSFSINGVWYPPHSAYWNADTFTWSGSLGQGYMNICIAVHDFTLFCPYNASINCWQFYLDQTSPFVEYTPPTFSACNPLDALIRAWDMDSIEIASFTCSICDSISYSFSYAVDTLIVNIRLWNAFVSDTVWFTGHFCDSLAHCTDTVFFALIDRTPPMVTIITPADGETMFTQSSTVIVSASDNHTGVDVGDIFIVVNGHSVNYPNPALLWDGYTLTFNLVDAGMVLLERGWNTIVVGNFSDSVSSALCGPNIAPNESISVFVADDDTLGPIITGQDTLRLWCGQNASQFLWWQITDWSGIQSVYSILSTPTTIDTVPLILSSGDIFVLSDPVIVSEETVKIVLMATDSDNDTGFGNDFSSSTSETTYILCRKPYVYVFPDSLFFGNLCVGDTSENVVIIVNPTPVEVPVHLQISDTAFRIFSQTHDIQPNETLVVQIFLSPSDTLEYAAILTTAWADTTTNVILYGSGKFCPGKFSALPNPFSPNGDGVNDKIYFLFPEYNANKVEIYDLWGYRMRTLESNGVLLIWNGNDDNGRPCPPASYIFFAYHNERLIAKGFITLAR